MLCLWERADIPVQSLLRHVPQLHTFAGLPLCPAIIKGGNTIPLGDLKCLSNNVFRSCTLFCNKMSRWAFQAPRKFLTRTTTTVQRAFTQAFRCFSLYQSRLVLGVLIALVYGGTYSHLPYSFQGLQERLSLLFIVSAILPLLTLGALPTFAHNDKVLLKNSMMHLAAATAQLCL